MQYDEDKYLFDLKSKDDVSTVASIHDIGCLMMAKGVQQAYDYLVDVIIPERIERLELDKGVNPNDIVFKSPILADHREREEAALALNEDVGILTDEQSCGRCNAIKVHKRIAQTRSVDEGATALFDCPKCKFTWSEN